MLNTDYNHRLYGIVGVISKEALAGHCPPILLCYNNDKDRRSEKSECHAGHSVLRCWNIAGLYENQADQH